MIEIRIHPLSTIAQLKEKIFLWIRDKNQDRESLANLQIDT